MPWVDSATNNQRLRAMPNPQAWVWDEIHPNGPPGWNQNLYWPWEDVRLLLTFIPSRMRTTPPRAVVLKYRPVHLPHPVANPLGLRPVNLQRVFSYACGNAQANSCAIGERLVGACGHCTVALTLAGVYPGNQGLFCTTHRDVHLLDRKNNPNMDATTLTEMS